VQWLGRALPGHRELRGKCSSSLLRLGGLVALGLVFLGLSGCDGETVTLPEPRFAQVGQIQIQVRSPLAEGTGVLEESFSWRSEGPWVLAERVSFEGRPGSETVRRPVLNPGDLAPEYSSLIQQLNDAVGLRLFTPETPQELEPECGDLQSVVVFTLRDELRGEEARWVRCAEGSFFTATPGGAGPDPGASRIVTAMQLARFFTLGDQAGSSYLGTVPFRTLDRGDDSPARPTDPVAFRSTDGLVPPGWEDFWERHTGGSEPLPQVAWDREMILLAAQGPRPEAGDSIQFRRILPIDQGTRVEFVRRVPGDFCSPASRESYPFHLILAPRTAAPLEFSDPVVERVPCGGG